MADVHSKETRSYNMSRIRSKNTKIELLLAKQMWKNGLRYRKNDKLVYGKPDFTFRKIKLAIFCDSEFWHGKDWAIQQMRIGTKNMFKFKSGNSCKKYRTESELNESHS